MKSQFPALAILAVLPFLANCSSHPEIVPYESARVTELNVDDASVAIANDSVFEDAIDSEKSIEVAEETTPSTDSVASLEEPVAPTLTPHVPQAKVKANASRHPASARSNGFYTFSRDCVMRVEPSAGSGGAGEVPVGKKLWLDVHNSQWLKAYKKAGTVYVPTSCVK